MEKHLDMCNLSGMLDTLQDYLAANIVLLNTLCHKVSHFEQLCGEAAGMVEQARQDIGKLQETLAAARGASKGGAC